MALRFCFLLLILFSLKILAQDDGDIEKIRVTGSHIKRIDLEGPSPITIIDQEELEASGVSSIGDVIRDQPVASFGVSKQYTLFGGGSGGATSLRGLPRGYTITLIDGRSSPVGDLNLIPKSAIERIEILSDGASAIYGSHALGGVFNFITKSDLTGTIMEGGVAVPEAKGGSEFYTALTKGFSRPSGSGLFSFFYRHDEPLYLRDRPYSQLTDYDDWSTLSSPGNFKRTGDKKFSPMPGCETKNSEGECVFNTSKYMQEMTRTDTLGFFATLKWDLGGDKTAILQTLSSYKSARGELAPAPDRLTDKMTDKMKQAWGQPNLEQIRYRIVDEKGAGLRKSHFQSLSSGIYAGVESYIGDHWDLQSGVTALGSFGFTKKSGYFNTKILFPMAEEGKWNPFREEKDDISETAYHPMETDVTFGLGPEVIASGSLAQMKWGSLNAALGARGGWSFLSTSYDEITWDKKESKSYQWGGGVAETMKGSRASGSAFGEFSFLSDHLELQAAGEAAYYQYSGRTANPKLSGKWSPSNWLALRGSWGTGYKAPGIKSLFLDKVKTHPQGKDYVACKKNPKDIACTKGKQFEMILSGNKNLKPETSEFYNIGLLMQPLDRWSLSFDLYDNEIKNMIRKLSNDEITYLESEGRMEELKQLNGQPIRGSGGQLEKIIASYTNAGAYKAQGMEFSLKGEVPLDDYTLLLKFDQNYNLKTQEKSFNIGQYVNRRGHWGYPVFRNRAVLGLKSREGISLELSSRGTAPYNQQVAKPDKEECQSPDCGGKIPVNFNLKPIKLFGRSFDLSQHIELSLSLSVPIQKVLGRFVSNDVDGRLQLKLENLLDSDPPEHRKGSSLSGNKAGVSTFDYTIRDLFYTNGRVWRLNYSQSF